MENTVRTSNELSRCILSEEKVSSIDFDNWSDDDKF